MGQVWGQVASHACTWDPEAAGVGKGPASAGSSGQVPAGHVLELQPPLLTLLFCSAALVLGFDWGKFLKDHSYKAAPVSCFKHVSALELRWGEQGARVLSARLTYLPHQCRSRLDSGTREGTG